MIGYKLTFKDKQMAILSGANEVLPDVINDKRLVEFNSWCEQAYKNGNIDNSDKWMEAFNNQLLKNCKEPLRSDTNDSLEHKIGQAENESELIDALKSNTQNESKDKKASDGVFIPTWDNKPLPRKPILSINGVGILRYQNMTCIIASPGMGKSSVCESIISSVINKDCDSLGFESDVKSVLYIDFERAQEDVWNSFYRTMNRANIKQGETTNKANIISLRNIATAKDRKAKIEELLQEYKPELLLLDGIGDVVNDTNSLEQCIEAKNWVRYINAEFKTSILTTLHPNPTTLKPRGHLGSETLREAEGILAITADADGVRTLTSNFEHGKARNGGHATTFFEWSDEDNMFVTNFTKVLDKVRMTKVAPEEKLSHEELIQLVKYTHSQPLNAETTKAKVKDYLETKDFKYIKKHRTDILRFVKFLEDNNYLTVLNIGSDKRTKYYKIHTIHE